MWEMDRVAGYCFIPLFPESWGWGRGGARQVNHNIDNIPIMTRIIWTILSNILRITLKTILRVRRRRELSCLEKLSFLLARKKAAVQVLLGCPGTFALSRYFWGISLLHLQYQKRKCWGQIYQCQQQLPCEEAGADPTEYWVISQEYIITS